MEQNDEAFEPDHASSCHHRRYQLGLVGLFQFDLVAAIFGGQQAVLARVVYILVGASAVWQLIPLTKAFGSGEPFALRGH